MLIYPTPVSACVGRLRRLASPRIPARGSSAYASEPDLLPPASVAEVTLREADRRYARPTEGTQRRAGSDHGAPGEHSESLPSSHDRSGAPAAAAPAAPAPGRSAAGRGGGRRALPRSARRRRDPDLPCARRRPRLHLRHRELGGRKVTLTTFSPHFRRDTPMRTCTARLASSRGLPGCRSVRTACIGEEMCRGRCRLGRPSCLPKEHFRPRRPVHQLHPRRVGFKALGRAKSGASEEHRSNA